MIFPNKFIKFEESVLNKMIHVIRVCEQNREISVHDLYQKTDNKFSAVDEFLLSIDVLHLLDVIDVNFEDNTVRYAKQN